MADKPHIPTGTVQRIRNFFEVPPEHKLSCGNIKSKLQPTPGALEFNKEEILSFPRSALMEMALHYRKLCEKANEEELFICSDILKVAPISNESCKIIDLNRSLLPLTLDEVRSLPGNEVCADCRSPDTSWASTNIGVFLCIRCSGVHRSLGVHISTILSCTLDIWPPELVQKIQLLGNRKVNDDYEYYLAKAQRNIKLRPTSSMQERQVFIKAKYIAKSFHYSCKEPDLVLMKYSSRRAKLMTSRIMSISQTNLRSDRGSMDANLFVNQINHQQQQKKKSQKDHGMIQYCGIVFITVHSVIRKTKKKESKATLPRKLGKNSSFISSIFISFSLANQIEYHKSIATENSKSSNLSSGNNTLKLNLPLEDKELIVSLHRRSRITQDTSVLSKFKVNLCNQDFQRGPVKNSICFPDGKTTIDFSIAIENLS